MNMVRRAAVIDIECKNGMLTNIYIAYHWQDICLDMSKICKELSKYDKEIFFSDFVNANTQFSFIFEGLVFIGSLHFHVVF